MAIMWMDVVQLSMAYEYQLNCLTWLVLAWITNVAYLAYSV